MNNKTILYLVGELYPCKTGGLELFHYYLIKNISKHLKTIVLTKCNNIFNSSNIKIINISSPFGRLQTLFTIFYHIKYIFKFKRTISLIHVPYSSKALFQYYYVVIFYKLWRIPYILRISDGEKAKPYFNYFHKILFSNAKEIITVSEHMKNEYEKRYNIPINIIPSYLPFLRSELSRDELRIKLGMPIKDIVLLYVGRLVELKNLQTIILALANIDSKYLKKNNIKFLVLGDGLYKKELESLIRKYNLQYFVRLYGNVDYEVVHYFYQLADIFVFPSFFEARPLCLSEALYHGMPVIVSNIPINSELIKHNENGFLFNPRKYHEFIMYLQLLIDEEPLRKKIIENNRKFIEIYNKFNIMIRQYLQTYYRHI